MSDGEKPSPRAKKHGLKTYEEMMDEIIRWNIEQTDILDVLRGRIREERLLSWSHALGIGIRRVSKGPEYARRSPEYSALRDLNRFIAEQRIELLTHPPWVRPKELKTSIPSQSLFSLKYGYCSGNADFRGKKHP